MRIASASALVPLFILVGCQPADPPGGDAARPPGSDFEGTAFEFEEVVPGIYHARGTGNLSVGSHGAVIVNDDDVLLVESHISAAAAYAVVDEIEALTGKPVRYVVNTHYHFDHAHGNQIYPDDVHVIGHEVTREMLENRGIAGAVVRAVRGEVAGPDRSDGRRARGVAAGALTRRRTKRHARKRWKSWPHSNPAWLTCETTPPARMPWCPRAPTRRCRSA